MSRNPQKMTGDELKKAFEAHKQKLNERMTQLEEELIREGVLKSGEHLTISEASRIVQERNGRITRVSSAQAEGSSRGWWTSSGDFIPQEKIPEYIKKFIGIEPTSARDDAVRSWLANTKGTLFNPQSAATGSVSTGTQTDPCAPVKK